MTDHAGLVRHFRELHQGDGPLLCPNPWDAGSARILAALGFRALATTSSGFAATLGRLDYEVTRNEALDHAIAIVRAVGVPVTADLENAFADDVEGVTATVRLARGTGLAGCSVEDSTRSDGGPVYELGHAVDRVRAAADAAHEGEDDFVLTARAEGFLYGETDLAAVIARLQGFQEAGADVLFAPGIRELDQIRTLVAEVDLPVNVIASAGGPTVAELASVGVARISVGGSFAYAALGGLVDAATELLEHGTYGYSDQGGRGRAAAREAFTD